MATGEIRDPGGGVLRDGCEEFDDVGEGCWLTCWD